MIKFKDVVGHKDILDYIKQAVAEDKVSHAYILSGPRGAGKKLLAELFAETLECEDREDPPCGKCHACIQMEGHNHPDVVWLHHEKPNTISVEDIRLQINQDIQIKPYQGPYKIYIINEAQMMTPQAQNALLKTIEEPPAYAVVFLLTENAESLLPTITSRCVMLKLRNLKDSLIRRYLMEKMEVPDYKADLCTAFAQGTLGRAIMLAGSEHFGELRDEVVQLLKYVHEMEIDEIAKAVKRAGMYKLEVADYLDIIMIWYRDVLYYKATKEVDKLVFKDQISAIREQAKNSSYEGIEQVLESLEKAKARLRANVNYDLVMELLFLTIKEA